MLVLTGWVGGGGERAGGGRVAGFPSVTTSSIRHVFAISLKSDLINLIDISPYCTREITNICNFPFAFLHTKSLLKRSNALKGKNLLTRGAGVSAVWRLCDTLQLVLVPCGGGRTSPRTSPQCRLYFISYGIIGPIVVYLKIEFCSCIR